MPLKITMLDENASPLSLPKDVELVLVGDGVELGTGQLNDDGTVSFDAAVSNVARLSIKARSRIPDSPA
jgi:hypothetical protein